MAATFTAAAATSACLNFSPFACQDDTQCDAEPLGRCELGVGYCSYPDVACLETGYRYEPDAGDGLGGECVIPGGVGTGSTTTDISGDNNRGVFAASNNNALIPGFNNVDAPVASVTRGAAVVRGGKTILPVIGLDPRPANAALTSVASAPNDGFFTPANYRGAFAPGNGPTWLCGWTASDAFGFTSGDCIGANYCAANANSSAAAAPSVWPV